MTPQILLLGDHPFNFHLHTLIFTHIPKCGGTSLHETFSGIFGPRYRVFEGDPKQRIGVASLRAAGGHQRFGDNPLHRRKTPLVYTTVIREPFEQFLSFYNHIQRDTHHPMRIAYPAIVRQSPSGLFDYLESIGDNSAINFQASMLAPTAKTPEEAIAHVERNYSLVGVLDNMRPYMDGLARMFPEHRVQTHNLNVSPRNVSFLHRWNTKFRRRFYDKNVIDLAIYERFSRSR